MNDTKITMNDTKNEVIEQSKTALHSLFYERTHINDFRNFDPEKHIRVCV